jgi:hypothetical protein
MKDLLKSFFGKPIIEIRNGKPYTSFNKIQAYLYPEICKRNFDEVTKSCTIDSREFQRGIFNTCVRNIF